MGEGGGGGAPGPGPARDAVGAAKLLPAAYQAVDKAAKRGVLSANTAARKKAGLARLVRVAA